MQIKRLSNSITAFTNTNIAIGFEALRGGLAAGLNTGNGNSVLGYQAMLSNTTGSYNVANGYQALLSNTTGGSNVANGADALNANTTGFSNTANGVNALFSNTIGNFNTAVGANAMYSNVAGNNGVAIGRNAMLYADNTTTAFDNTNIAIGFEALRGSTTPSANTGISNSVVGYQAMLNNTVGNNNTANGTFALLSNIIGNNNTANGADALLNNTTGNNNTAMGVGAASNITTGSNNIAIGYNVQVPSTTASNQISIGNLIYAINATGSGAGNVGIGTNNPTRAKLEVSGFVNTNVGSYGFLGTGGAGTGGGGAQDFSIIASHRMAATEFNAYSDARIKHITGRSNTAQDLATLAQLQITNYTHIDHVNKGSREIKKVIAQEVKQVYPQAVSYLTDVVPNIYKIASMNTEGVVSVENDLKVGEKVKIIFNEEGAQLLEVQEANATSFKVASTKAGKVFVYGHEVSDFHVVDYEALSTLNISATQELLKRIQTLEAENNTLKAQVSDLNNLKAEVQKIKEALQIEASQKK